MSGIPGLRCPECGYEATGESELRLQSTRDRWHALGWTAIIGGSMPLLLILLGWIAIAIALPDHSRWATPRILESQQRGDQIIAAIAGFQQKNGRLPTHLDELIPAHLDTIPRPTAGYKKWSYTVARNPNRFSLCFGADSGYYPCSYYTGPNGSWQIDQ